MPQSSALSSVSFKQTPAGSSFTIDAVGSVTFTYNRAPFEVSEIGNANAQFIAGYQNCTAQLELFYLEADHEDIELNINQALAVAQVVITLATNDTITGDAYVTAYTVTAAANDVVRASITLQFTGAIAAA